MGEWVLSRDFPDGSRSDVHIRALPAVLQDRSEVWTAIVTLVGFAEELAQCPTFPGRYRMHAGIPAPPGKLNASPFSRRILRSQSCERRTLPPGPLRIQETAIEQAHPGATAAYLGPKRKKKPWQFVTRASVRQRPRLNPARSAKALATLPNAWGQY
jgi:hypothetical protein